MDTIITEDGAELQEKLLLFKQSITYLKNVL